MYVGVILDVSSTTLNSLLGVEPAVQGPETSSSPWASTTHLFHPLPCASYPRTMQNYLIWRLVLDRISSLSQRFKEARASYRKVSDTPPPCLSPHAKPGLPLVPL